MIANKCAFYQQLDFNSAQLENFVKRALPKAGLTEPVDQLTLESSYSFPGYYGDKIHAHLRLDRKYTWSEELHVGQIDRKYAPGPHVCSVGMATITDIFVVKYLESIKLHLIDFDSTPFGQHVACVALNPVQSRGAFPDYFPARYDLLPELLTPDNISSA